MKTFLILFSITFLTLISCKEKNGIDKPRRHGMIIDPFYPYNELDGKKNGNPYINYLGQKDNC